MECKTPNKQHKMYKSLTQEWRTTADILNLLWNDVVADAHNAKEKKIKLRMISATLKLLREVDASAIALFLQRSGEVSKWI